MKITDLNNLTPFQARQIAYAKEHPQEHKNLLNLRSHTVGENSFKAFVDLKCIFVHIPKTAGISVCTTLFGNRAGGHTSLNTYQLVFSEDEFRSFFKFTFVRNPWDRLFSAYQFLMQGGMNSTDKDWAEQNIYKYASFEQFVLDWVNPKNILTCLHFAPQYYFVGLPGETSIHLDFIGYFENIEKDFEYVAHKLKPNVNLHLPHKNATFLKFKSNYQTQYSQESYNVVAKIYQTDIELFGYTFDNSSLPTNLKARTI